jgi:hypothetical protein
MNWTRAQLGPSPARESHPVERQRRNRCNTEKNDWKPATASNSATLFEEVLRGRE